MTWPAALPEAAMRAMRTAAEWRALRPALRVLLLAGALFVLGVLCGERAQAAERTPTDVSVAGIVSETVPNVAPDTRADSDDSTRPGSIGDVAERGVAEVAELVDEASPVRLPKSPEAPPPHLRLPKLPETVSLPVLPVLPVLPGTTDPAPLPDLPGELDTPQRPLPAPLTPEPEQDPAPAPAPERRPEPEPEPESAAEQGREPHNAATPPPVDSPTPGRHADPPAAAPHGPEATRSSTTTAAARTGTGSPSVSGDEPAATSRTGEADPAPRAPGGRPDGSLGSRSATDHGQPRPGDTHAVTSHHPRPLPLLVRAAPAHTETPDPRDRFEDVPVPPA